MEIMLSHLGVGVAYDALEGASALGWEKNFY